MDGDEEEEEKYFQDSGFYGNLRPTDQLLWQERLGGGGGARENWSWLTDAAKRHLQPGGILCKGLLLDGDDGGKLGCSSEHLRAV